MSSLLLEFLNLWLVVIEFFVFVLLSIFFFHFRYSVEQILLFGLIICFGFSGRLKTVGSLVILLLLIVCFLLFSRRPPSSQGEGLTHCLLQALLWLSVINLVDSAFLTLVSAAEKADWLITMENPYGYYLLTAVVHSVKLPVFITKSIELLLAAILYRWLVGYLHTDDPVHTAYTKVSVFSFVTLLCSAGLTGMLSGYTAVAPQLLVGFSALLMSNTVAVVLLGRLETQQRAVLENQLLQQQLKLAHSNIDALSSAYHNERKMSHDFQNKLSVLYGMVQQDPADALSYLRELLQQDYSPALSMTTHRTAADVLLNQKYLAAGEKQIRFSVRLDDLTSFPLSDDALVVVLSNLIDNAMEACEKIAEPDKRYILVKARVTPATSVLYIENPVAENVPVSGGRPATSKADPRRHGFGLQNVAAIVSAAGGTMDMDCRELVFSTVITFVTA